MRRDDTRLDSTRRAAPARHPGRAAVHSPGVHDALRHPLTYLVAALLAVAASRRLTRELDRRAFDDLIAWLRCGRPLRGRLADPTVHLRVVGRLNRWLPPRRMGPCLRRSLVLLHLWSRCGLEPVLHLGFASRGDDRWQGHAWLTARRAGDELRAGSADDHVETFVY